jgi:hypothetical protein
MLVCTAAPPTRVCPAAYPAVAAQYEQDYLPKRLNNWQVNPTLDNKVRTAVAWMQLCVPLCQHMDSVGHAGLAGSSLQVRRKSPMH